MQITYFGQDKFEIKSKNATIYTGEKPSVNGVELSGPGEYEVSEIFVEGLFGGIYLFRLEEMTLASLDRLNRTLTDEQVDKINGVDILMVPIGRGDILNPKQAIEVINQIDPKIVIPMDFGALNEFCQLEGVCSAPLPEFKISASGLPSEERKVVILCPKTR